MRERGADAATARDQRGAAWSEAAIRADPLGFAARCERRLAGLADTLERVADGLPRLVCPSAALIASARLRAMAASDVAQRPGEEVMRLVERGVPGDHPAARIVLAARREGAVAAALGAELSDALDELLRQGAAAAPEALGFQLRACFEAIRRRADWFETAILPRAQTSLGPADRAALGARLWAVSASARGRGRAAQATSAVAKVDLGASGPM